MQEKTGRAIMLTDHNKLVTIKRTKYKNGKIVKEYYTFPGGHVEEGESFETATLRELEEELGIRAKIEKEFCHLFNEELQREEAFFLVKHISGEIGSGKGPEFVNINYERYGKYEIVLLDIQKLQNYTLYPLEIRDLLISLYSK